ncbi:MAG: tRNA (adenosine(37)-N6)-threonylcarbamoyltransferase complex dimerization subunit type 1 TsaB [Actinobacteria bacterium]|nr:tRNA (adenosine(37)-N6)-threonylcarbamoyltransferase complex dimerization subunit type 1 TsaB [Actinomycetota bacterium]NBY15125.1 tRNA (adenosine(37)-N6)-threonylcarbamoyltransferase complex dimerization subunit type 1 TsaB [Actinomycetota bacterium]
MILAIDTSVGISVAIHDGTETVSEFSTGQHGSQGELTAKYIQSLLDDADCFAKDIRTVLVGVGPGPFTGLRVGITTALTFAHALQIPVHGICSLDAVGFTQSKECIVVSDARRKELYWARYQDRIRVSEPAVDKPNQISNLLNNLSVIGPAAQMYPEFFTGELVELRAGFLADLYVSELAEIKPVLPLYLRKPDAVEPVGVKQVLR